MKAYRLHPLWLHDDLAALCLYRCLKKGSEGSTKFKTKQVGKDSIIMILQTNKQTGIS